MAELLKRTNDNIDFERIELELDKETQIKRRNEYKIPDFIVNKDEFFSELSKQSIINARRTIISHRPLVGSMLVKMRQLLDEEIRLSVDPVMSKQQKFNEYFSNELKGHSEFDIHLRERIEIIERILDEMRQRIERQERVLDESNTQTNENIKEIFRLKRKIKDEN